MKLKQLLYILLVSVGIQQSHGQTYKFVTTGFSVSEKTDKGKWGKWSDLQKASIVITVDETKNRIVIYSQEIQLYNILEYEDKVENDNEIVYTYICSDNDGKPYTISIFIRKNQGNRKQLYIYEKKRVILYNMKNYKDDLKK